MLKVYHKTKGCSLFFRTEGKYSFWMKNTLIPLDMIWINKDKKVVFIEKDAKPCVTVICPIIVPDHSANYVLETNAGQAQKNGIIIGDLVKINK